MFQLVFFILFTSGFTESQGKNVLCSSSDVEISYSFCESMDDVFFISIVPCSFSESRWTVTLLLIPRNDIIFLEGSVNVWYDAANIFTQKKVICSGFDDDYSFCGTLKGAVLDDDPAHVRFKNTFNANLTKCKEDTNVKFLKRATALNPRFKNLKCLPKSGMMVEAPETYESLAHLACKYLATLATKVPCKCLFSLSGDIVNKKQAALSSVDVNKLVCLSNWLNKK